jgi:hypothetical protein
LEHLPDAKSQPYAKIKNHRDLGNSFSYMSENWMLTILPYFTLF